MTFTSPQPLFSPQVSSTEIDFRLMPPFAKGLYITTNGSCEMSIQALMQRIISRYWPLTSPTFSITQNTPPPFSGLSEPVYGDSTEQTIMPLPLPHSLQQQLYPNLVAALARRIHSSVLSLSLEPSTPDYFLVLESSSRPPYSPSNFSNGGMHPILQGSYPAKPLKASISPLLSSPVFHLLNQTCHLQSRLDKSHKPPNSNTNRIPSPSPFLLHRVVSRHHPTPQPLILTRKQNVNLPSPPPLISPFSPSPPHHRPQAPSVLYACMPFKHPRPLKQVTCSVTNASLNGSREVMSGSLPLWTGLKKGGGMMTKMMM